MSEQQRELAIQSVVVVVVAAVVVTAVVDAVELEWMLMRKRY